MRARAHTHTPQESQKHATSEDFRVQALADDVLAGYYSPVNGLLYDEVAPCFPPRW